MLQLNLRARHTDCFSVCVCGGGCVGGGVGVWVCGWCVLYVRACVCVRMWYYHVAKH